MSDSLGKPMSKFPALEERGYQDKFIYMPTYPRKMLQQEERGGRKGREGSEGRKEGGKGGRKGRRMGRMEAKARRRKTRKKGNRKENERNKAIVSAVAFILLKGHAQADLHNAQCIIYVLASKENSKH